MHLGHTIPFINISWASSGCVGRVEQAASAWNLRGRRLEILDPKGGLLYYISIPCILSSCFGSPVKFCIYDSEGDEVSCHPLHPPPHPPSVLTQTEPEFLNIYWRLKGRLFKESCLFKGYGVQQG